MDRIVDIPLTPDQDGRWTNKFLPGHVDEVDNVTWTAADGIRYLNPEIVLFYKARAPRPKDEWDLDAVLPTLTDDGRSWLRHAVSTLRADHEWLARL